MTTVQSWMDTKQAETDVIPGSVVVKQGHNDRKGVIIQVLVDSGTTGIANPKQYYLSIPSWDDDYCCVLEQTIDDNEVWEIVN